MVDREQNIIKAALVGDAVFTLFVQETECVDHDNQVESLRQKKQDVKRDQFQVTEISVLDLYGGHWRQKKSGKLRKYHSKKDTQHGQKLTQEIPPMQKEHEKDKVGIGDYQAKGGIVRQRGIGQKASYRVQRQNQRIIETRRELGGEEPAEGAIPHRLLREIHQQIGKYIQGCSGHGDEIPFKHSLLYRAVIT